MERFRNGREAKFYSLTKKGRKQMEAEVSTGSAFATPSLWSYAPRRRSLSMRWLRRLFQKSRADNDLDRELHFHLERQIADHIAAGNSAEEARRRANLEFGGLERVKEEVRDTAGKLTSIICSAISATPSVTSVRTANLPWWPFSRLPSHWCFYSRLQRLLQFTVQRVCCEGCEPLVVPVMQDGSRVYCNLSAVSSIRDQNQTFENVIGYTNGFALVRDGLQTYQLHTSSVTADALSSMEFLLC